jgi:hypothetical protein
MGRGFSALPTPSPTILPPTSDATERSQVLTLNQAADYLRMSRAHLSNLINGKVRGVPCLRHARPGRRILIKREWAGAWLEMAAQESQRQW